MPVFAENAPSLAQHGLAVIPLGGEDGKRPLVGNFHKWKRPPGMATIEELAAKHPDANVGVVTGPSGVIVVDCDDRDDEEEAERAFGWTPLRTRTSRGVHLWYAAPGVNVKQANLRRFGLNVDVKAGSGYVVAPPSLHKTGTTYTLEECDWGAIHELPLFDVSAIERLTGRRASPILSRGIGPVREGERALALNRHLCREVSSCDTLDALIDVAQTVNNDFIPPLDADEVARIAARVWADGEAGKIKRWHGGGSVVKASISDVDALLNLDPKTGPDALALWMTLRANHSARCVRGEPFSITPKAMAYDVLPWARERIERARDLLLKAGLIRRVRDFSGKGHGALYMLAEVDHASC